MFAVPEAVAGPVGNSLKADKARSCRMQAGKMNEDCNERWTCRRALVQDHPLVTVIFPIMPASKWPGTRHA